MTKTMSNKFPGNCNECHDTKWCDSFYGGLGCYYKDAICRQIVKDYKENEEKKMEAKEDVVKNPSHYKHGEFETIDEMIIIFGPQRTYDYCIVNAWKYRARAMYKENAEQDMKKSDEYLSLAKQIVDKNPQHFYGAPINLIKTKE